MPRRSSLISEILMGSHLFAVRKYFEICVDSFEVCLGLQLRISHLDRQSAVRETRIYDLIVQHFALCSAAAGGTGGGGPVSSPPPPPPQHKTLLQGRANIV